MKFKRILFTIFLCFSLCCSMYSTIFAANPVVSIDCTDYDEDIRANDYGYKITYENNKKYFNGTANLLFVNGDVVLDADAVIINGTTLVPLRVISEKLNADVKWNSTTKTAEIQKDNISISVPIEKRYINVNGKTIETTAEAKIINSLTYVPLRAIASCFGANVGFYNIEDNINIIYVHDKKDKINISEEEAINIAEKIYKEDFLPTIDYAIQGLYDKTALELVESEGNFHAKITADFGEYYYVTFYDNRIHGLFVDKYDRTCYPVYFNMYCIFGVGQTENYNQWTYAF